MQLVKHSCKFNVSEVGGVFPLVKVYFMTNQHMSAVTRPTNGRHFTNRQPTNDQQTDD